MSQQDKPPKLEIIFPVRNEENRLENGIRRTIDYLSVIGFNDYLLTIADNESNDSTSRLAQDLARENDRVSYLYIPEKGVGVAVRTAMEQSAATIIGYMDIDLATDLHHLQEVIALFECNPKLQIVNGSRWANGYWSSGRDLNRVITSFGLVFALRHGLGMKASDAICGFKFFRRPTALRLIETSDRSDNGWFFIIEMLIRAERLDIPLKELPVTWTDDGHSSVKSLPIARYYLRRIRELRSSLNSSKKRGTRDT